LNLLNPIVVSGKQEIIFVYPTWMHPGRIWRCREGDSKSLLMVREKVTNSHVWEGSRERDFFSLIFFIVVLGVHCGIYKSSYNVSTISYLNSPPLPVSFILPFPHSWNTFNSHFSISIYVYTVFALYSPSHVLPPPHWYQPPLSRTCSAFLFSSFVKEKKKTFLFVYKSYTGSWEFYNPNWFISSIFLLSTLVSILWWVQQV
jgi:hypothetical protein